eukprot:Skav218586  [mRNA]  locus=scaffold2610:673524:683787:- [translate_table: standard]
MKAGSPDLRLMVKGLVAGLKTLVLAFTLLFTVLYVISGFATMTIGTSECVNDEGQPIHSMLQHEFGLIFVASFMLVSLGIFNVILAVPGPTSLLSNVPGNDLTVEQHSRESIRIARIARELLKKFAAAFRLFQDLNDDEGGEVERLPWHCH